MRGQPRVLRLPYQLTAIAIRKNETGALWQHMRRKVRGDGEIEPVAMRQVVVPFAVALKVEQAGLDLHHPNIAAGRDADHVGAASIGERELRHDRVAEAAQIAADAALQLRSHGRLPTVEGQQRIVVDGRAGARRGVESHRMNLTGLCNA